MDFDNSLVARPLLSQSIESHVSGELAESLLCVCWITQSLLEAVDDHHLTDNVEEAKAVFDQHDFLNKKRSNFPAQYFIHWCKYVKVSTDFKGFLIWQTAKATERWDFAEVWIEGNYVIIFS